MLDLVQEFVEQSTNASDAASLSSLFGQAVSRLGFDNYSAWSLIDGPEMPEETILMLTYPASWVAHYRDMNYVQVDPVYRLGMESTVPFLWSDIARSNSIKRAERRFLDDANDAGLKFGLTVPVRGAFTPPGNVNVYSEDGDFDPHSIHTLHLMSIYLYEAGCRLENERRNRFSLGDRPTLTERERECLRWAAMGKTDWEIGEILGISQSTAHFHIEKAKKKFGVATRTQAVVQAVVTNQIIP